MLNDYKVKQIIEFVRDKEYNSLNEAYIFGCADDTFCVSFALGGYCISYETTMKDNKINRYVNNYFYDRVNNNWIYAVLPDANEIIALLHEIGHIKYMELYGSIKNKPYKEVQEKEYLTLEQGLKAYREIPTEKYADEFAINFINKYAAELTNLLDPSQSVESVREFLEME